MKRYVIAILVRNQFGVLNRVTSMFRRRQFNIDCLTVSETESTAFSRITVRFEGDEDSKKQLVSQLLKLPDVESIKELDTESTIATELLLVKMANEPATREEVRAAAEAFEAKIVDYTRDAMTLQMVGEPGRVDAFVNLMGDYTILEICRSGIVSLERGSSTIRKVTNL